MITQHTKELPFNINLIKGKIAFVGDQTHCSNIAARIHKYKNFTKLASNLRLTSDIKHNKYTSVELYYAGESTDALNLKAKTDIVYVITDDETRAGLYIDYINQEQPKAEVNHIPAVGSDGLTRNINLLMSTDWCVLRELERMFLLDTSLSKEREVYRVRVDSDITNALRG